MHQRWFQGILFTYSALATWTLFSLALSLATRDPGVFCLLPVSRSLAASNTCIICDQILRYSSIHSHPQAKAWTSNNETLHQKWQKIIKNTEYMAEYPNPILFYQVSTCKSLTFISSMIFKACSFIAAFAIALTTLPKLMVSGSFCSPCFGSSFPCWVQVASSFTGKGSRTRFLVGGCNPFEKYDGQNGNLPIPRGEN